jgi:hypothetical protein
VPPLEVSDEEAKLSISTPLSAEAKFSSAFQLEIGQYCESLSLWPIPELTSQSQYGRRFVSLYLNISCALTVENDEPRPVPKNYVDVSLETF